MRKTVLVILLLLGASCYGQETQQPNAQNYPPDAGPFRSGQFYVLPVNATPQVPYGTVAPTRATGTTQRFYWVVTNDIDNAQSSIPAGPFSTSIGPATLSSSNTIKITWPVFALPLTYGVNNVNQSQNVTDNITYDVLETATNVPPSGTCNCAVATGLTSSFTADTGTYLSYTVIVPQWSNGYPTPGDVVTFGEFGILIDSLTPLPTNPINPCTTAGSAGNVAFYPTSTTISCDDVWTLTGTGELEGSGFSSEFNVTAVQSFLEPFCNLTGTPDLVSWANLRICAENNTVGGTFGFLHFWNFVNSTDNVLIDNSQLQSTTGPTGVAINYSRAAGVQATLNGTGFGPAGAGHSKGIVPDPGATAHTPAYYLGEDSAFHNPTAISPSSIGGTNVTQFQILVSSTTFSCSGDQDICSEVLTWPTTFADANYSAVCNPQSPSNTTGAETLVYAGSGSQSATQITVYIVSQGGTSKSFGGFVCWGWHQ